LWAVSFGAKYHQGIDDCEARYRHPLAPCRFQIVLVQEIAEPLQPTNCPVGNSPTDPRDEHRQPVVGSAENPWRASQARCRDRPGQRRQVYGAEEGPSSQGWKTFLRNHAGGIVAMDLFVVPTISFRLLYGLLIIGHGRWQILWFGAPDGRMARQSAHLSLWLGANPSLHNQGPRSSLWRDFCPPGSVDRHSRPPDVFPLTLAKWHSERLIGSIRRECINHVVVFGERHLRHVLLSYKDYYNARALICH